MTRIVNTRKVMKHVEDWSTYASSIRAEQLDVIDHRS